MRELRRSHPQGRALQSNCSMSRPSVLTSARKRCSDTCVDVMAPEGEMRAFPRRLSKLIATASNGLPARNAPNFSDRLYAVSLLAE